MKNIKLITKFLEYLKNERKYSLHTIRSYKSDLIDFSNFIDKDNKKGTLIDIDKFFIQDFIKELVLSKLSDKTVQRKVASIKAFYKYLKNTKQIKHNISKYIVSPKISKKLPYLLTRKEINDLMNLPDLSSYIGIRDKSILEIFYSTGVRISEIINIKTFDIEMDKKLIKIYGKGNKERYVILGKEALNSVSDYLKIRMKMSTCSNEKIFLYPAMKKSNKGHISYKSMYNLVKKYIKKVSNNEKLSPHSLRHSFATHLLENGADIMSVKDLLGHKDLSSTQIYTNVSIKKIKEVYKIAHPHAK